MRQNSKELERITKEIKVADTAKDGVDHPVISSFYEMLFRVAGRVQPPCPSYEAAQRILDIIERSDPPDEINMDDLEAVFHATGSTFERVLIS